jgi:hypothetical protein
MTAIATCIAANARHQAQSCSPFARTPLPQPSSPAQATAVAHVAWPPIAIAALYLAALTPFACFAKLCGALLSKPAEAGW